MENLTYRKAPLKGVAGRPSSIDDSTRSVEVTVATERPVEIFDFERGEILPEIILMSGLQMPDSRQVPLLDSHQRYDTSNVIGSVRDIKVSDGHLVGRSFFSAEIEGSKPFAKVKEGHLTDFSAGYRVLESEFIPKGESTTYREQKFEGPLRLSTSWVLKEVSVVPIGADELAKARSAADINNPQQAKDYDMDKEEIEKIKEEERLRVLEIGAICSRFGCDDLAEKLVSSGASIDSCRSAVMDRLDAKSADNFRYYPPHEHHPAVVSVDATEKRSEATIDGLVLQAGIPLQKPAAGAREYRNLSTLDIARECLIAAGTKVHGLSKNRIVEKALSQRAASTGDFPFILSAAANKTLRTAYDLSPSTFQLWCNESDAPDFKILSRNQLSEFGNLDEIPEHGEYKHGKLAESKEEFAVTKKGKLFDITRESIVNDDLGAFLRLQKAQAASAKRGLNEACYAALTANAAMSDGKALFHADHSNFVGSGSGAAPSESTLSTARVSMRTQLGLNGALLNISPQFLIVPAALETAADKLLNSLGDLADNKSSGVVNPFYKKLEPVVESVLDATSSTAWFLACSPKSCDTIEVAYLNGDKRPHLESKSGWSVDGISYKVRFEYGVKAIDWRGLYMNYGA